MSKFAGKCQTKNEFLIFGNFWKVSGLIGKIAKEKALTGKVRVKAVNAFPPESDYPRW